MKIKHISIATLAGISLICSSCVVAPADGYGTFTYSTNGYNSSVAWTSASYDVNGFPIYGYSYGRPVYGYTATGAAIFSIAALTALCFVPDWGPAPWYHGHWHYPHHIHRVACPPRYAHGHHPGKRPPHSHNHHNNHPGHGIRPPHGNKPGHGATPPHGNRPGHGATPPRGNRPGHGATPSRGNRPNSGIRPTSGTGRPGHVNRIPGSTRPAGISRPSGSRGGFRGPGGHSGRGRR